MSDTIQYINYIGDAELFAETINKSDDGIYCLLLFNARESLDLSPERIDTETNTFIQTSIEKIVLNSMQDANATALYSDVLINNEQFSIEEIYPSHFMGLLNSGLIIQSPIFVINNTRLQLKYNPKIKVFHCHNYLQQIERSHRVIHIPECLYSMSISPNIVLDMGEDLKILND